MELNDDEGLSASERNLASALSQLAADPSPKRHAAIMSAVRQKTGQGHLVIGRWRPALAGLAAAAALTASTVGAFAASGDALPNSPEYQVRLVFERVRLTVAGPADREELRITFADARITQAHARLSQGDRANAEGLLRDSRAYLAETKNELGNVPAGERGQIEEQLTQAQADQQQTETQVDQQGEHGG